MKTTPVQIIFILDRSGSMSAIESDAIGGFNSFLASQQALEGDASFTLVLFDHEYEIVHQDRPIDNVGPLDRHTYAPRGTTALLDAIGRTVEDAQKRTRSDDKKDAERVLVAILTDGLENASRDYTRAQVAMLIEQLQRDEAWQFVFLAANQDAFSEAQSLSMDASAAMNFDATPKGVESAFMHLSESAASFRLPDYKSEEELS